MKKITFIFLTVIFSFVANKNLFTQCSYGDCQNDYGIYQYEGGRYEGYFAGGLMNGKGTFNWANGDKYVGEWLNDGRTGYGTYYWANGTQYEGYFKNNKRNGYGTRYFANGDKYVGNWVQNNYNGYGVLISGPDLIVNNCKSCTTYKGNWVDGVKSGFGRCYDKNGYLLYEGEFLDDRPVSTYPYRY